MNYYPFHLGDYAKDTAHLTMLEDGAYRRLLDLYYTRERPLPGDLQTIYRLCRARTKPEREAINNVLQEYFREEDYQFTHNRCEKEIESMKSKKVAAKTNGAKGGRPKRQGFEPDSQHSENNPLGFEKEPNGFPVGFENETQEKPHQSQSQYPNTKSQKNNICAAVAADDSLFEMFWAVYDFKIDKQKAIKAWQKLKVDDELARRICQAAQRYVAATPELKFRRHPTTWLNNRSWENEIVNQHAQPQMTHHQATTLAAARAIFGDERNLIDEKKIIDITPRKKLTSRHSGFDDIDYGETGPL